MMQVPRVVLLFAVMNSCYGLCPYQGLYFSNGTTWQLDSCQSCTCHDEVSVCRRQRCLDPGCHFDAGEELYIAANQCCPVCSQKKRNCTHEGKTYSNGAQWSLSQCQTCSCQDGVVYCLQEECPQLCVKASKSTRECCPQCQISENVCNYMGESFFGGESWSPDPCTRCECNGGQAECYLADCKPTICKGSETLLTPVGECCPRCLNAQCSHNGQLFRDGASWNDSSCVFCTCQAGRMTCLQVNCPSDVSCKEDEIIIVREGECCPTCLPNKGSCNYEGKEYYHGEIWNTNSCHFCSCSNGKINCRNSTCAEVQCLEGEKLVQMPGKCCSECVHDFSLCIEGEQMYKGGESWRKDNCTLCMCQEGQILCYKYQCPSCLAESRNPRCCSACLQTRCSQECQSCLDNNIHYCIFCKDENQVAQGGMCLSSCSTGFYNNGVRQCQPCHSSCKECYGPEARQCLSCPPGLYLAGGTCLRYCGPGFYVSHGLCLACHSSCRQCRGPKSNDCLLCTQPMDFLQESRCVESCDDHSYSINRYCQACNETCKTCFKDKPGCESCPPGYLLQDTDCVYKCGAGFYQDKNNMCLPCSSQCRQCDGPLQDNCLACDHKTFLLNKMCVPGCGDGFYADLSNHACRACHKNCRRCQNADSVNSCTSCWSKVLLRIGTDQHGQCLDTCPESFYLTTSGTCSRCPENCRTCWANECFSCHPPFFLMPNGKCVERCNVGQFRRDSLCYNCHATCKSCHGFLANTCDECYIGNELYQGSCKVPCRRRQYMDQHGICRDCDSSCNSCSYDHSVGRSICIECPDKSHYVAESRCVEKCESGFFIDDNRACKKCHPSCEECENSGITSCTRCASGLVMTHQSICLEDCFQGYYQQDGICLLCDSNCLECDGEGRCMTCAANLVLQFGECTDHCYEQYYIDSESRECRECSWKCNTCTGPNPNDCLTCVGHLFLEHGACVARCSEGYYQVGNMCKRCRSQCRSCNELGTCLSCPQPLFLQNGDCIHSCNKGMFPANTPIPTCSECAEHCLLCTDPVTCQHCTENYFLKQGRCVDQCGDGFLHDTIRRVCESNSAGPQLVVHSPLVANYGTLATLDTQTFEVIDSDTDPQKIRFQIEREPSCGSLALLRDDSHFMELQARSHFSLLQVEQGRVVFRHKRGAPLSGNFALKLNDGLLESEMQTVPVQVVSHYPPVVEQLQPLLITGQHKSLPITSKVLRVTDNDNLDDVNLYVIQGPKNGEVVNKHTLKPVQRFNYQELESGHLMYVSKNITKNASTDVTVLQVTDGYNIRVGKLVVQNLLNEEEPSLVLMANKPLRVQRGGFVMISSNVLRASDPFSDEKNVVYSLLSKPKQGRLVRMSSSPLANQDSRGTLELQENPVIQIVTSFTQEEINQGHIWYQNSGTRVTKDDFHFNINNRRGNRSSDIPPDLLFVINVIPNMSTINAGLSVTGLDPVSITNNELSFQLADRDARKIIFTITKPLAPNEGTLMHTDHPSNGGGVTIFTQQDINDFKILYQPPSETASLSEEMQVSFKFNVMDVLATEPEAEQTFTIRLLPTPVLEQVAQNGIIVERGGTVAIPPHILEVIDPNVGFMVTQEPSHGSLVDASQEEVILSEGDSFPFSTVVQQQLLYRHDGTESSGDQVVFSTIVGRHQTNTVIKIHILPDDKSPPTRLPSATFSITVNAGETVTITSSHLAYQDSSSKADQTIFSIIQNARHGQLLSQDGKGFKRGDLFTQLDINGNKISFVANPAVSNPSVTDRIVFDVADAKGNVETQQQFQIVIYAVNAQPPVLTVLRNLEVDEGGRGIIGSETLQAMDHDTVISELKVVIDEPPRFGFLHKMRVENGKESPGDMLPFPFQDILESQIQYVQNDHKRKEPTSDSVILHLTDGRFSSLPVQLNISINLLNDEAPVMTLKNLVVQAMGFAVLTNETILVQDADNSLHELMLTLETAPAHGFLQEIKADGYSNIDEGETFSYQDILDNLIGYRHNGSSHITSDSMVLVVSDGDFFDMKTLEISVLPTDSETPRVAINRGLVILAGNSAPINETKLRSEDTDSNILLLKYTVTSNPFAGHLVFVDSDGNRLPISKDLPHTFTQLDINNGRIMYVHRKGEKTGNIPFKFNVVDEAGNALLDQTFVINVQEDISPPRITVNKALTVMEDGSTSLTNSHLSASDDEMDSSQISYTIIAPPEKGVLEMDGSRVDHFQQSDIDTGRIQYRHTSKAETYEDAFTFVISDGTNNVTERFSIELIPVDDSLPFLNLAILRVQEGTEKIITEFDLKATDTDTKDSSIIFSIVKPPKHGTLRRAGTVTQKFTMSDIYEGRVGYLHDGSETEKDDFSFTVSDGTNPSFVVGGNRTNQPQVLEIEIQPVDDGTPILTTNLGLHYLQQYRNQVGNAISKHELQTEDADTNPSQLIYRVTIGPVYGNLVLSNAPNVPTYNFSQENINLGQLWYILTRNHTTATSDEFTFSVYDTRPNVITNNVFHIQWSWVSFHKRFYPISEKEGTVQLKVVRKGALKHYAAVECGTVEGKAKSEDFRHVNSQVQFEEWESEKTISIPIINDHLFEGIENFTVHLSMPSYTLLGEPAVATVTITDNEDELQITFEEPIVHVTESDENVAVSIVRTGDLSQEVSVVCYTNPLTAQGTRGKKIRSGSDYFTKSKSQESSVVFHPGVARVACNLRIIDDAIYEESEELELILTDIEGRGKLGHIAKAVVIIDGPNDAPSIFLSKPSYMVLERNGKQDIEVSRQGPDLSQTSTVWCGTRATRPPSALPGEDFVPTTLQITFAPQQTVAKCPITLVDDITNPKKEGLENIEVFLSNSIGATITEPSTSIVAINDSILDATRVEFQIDKATVKETEGKLVVQLLRTGDLSKRTTVKCQAVQGTALQGSDFSIGKKIIDFEPGEKEKQIEVQIISDDIYEGDETFFLVLSTSKDRTARATGTKSSIEITITDKEDVSRIQFKKSAYGIHEPATLNEIAKVSVSVWRQGDKSGTARVRVSTRDGSAISGIDYYGKSKEVIFNPGEEYKDFEVEVLHSKKRDWNKMFSVILGPEQPINATMGDPKMAIVQILDYETSGSWILPAPPMIVSLADYNNIEHAVENPTPGYPLVCVTPCDETHPNYADTSPMCNRAKINVTNIHYSWEAAIPTDADGNRQPFEPITDSTLFSTVHGKVLENIYFGRKFLIRCIAQAIDESRNFGTPLKSRPVQVGTHGLCQTKGQPSDDNLSFGLQSHSFVASLRYVNASDKAHPNTIHIHIKVPHQDGMLPLISTVPLHNVRYLLTQHIYRQQHLCSNLLVEGPLSNYGFLSPNDTNDHQSYVSFGNSERLENALRDRKSLMLYHHLHLKSCSWTFDSWYHMTDLVDLCGASVVSDFQTRDTGQTYLTVHLPLYVSYIFASAPTGWISMEHRTELEFSFFYSTVLWRTGLAADGHLKATLTVQRILIDNDGHLVIEFKTQAKFRGIFIMEHTALPRTKSQVIPPKTIPLPFELEPVWTESTFDGPNQLWKATSKYNLKDYTGDYSVQLMPCTVSDSQQYVKTVADVCVPQSLQKFSLPIGFQQASRPVPMTYSLNTLFQVMNDQNMFLTKPTTENLKDMDYRGSFSKDQTVYGRVLWDPTQDLDSAYKLQIEQVYLCSGSEGHVPTFDPTGEDYGEGPQFGCIQKNKNLKYRFLLLDRNNMDAKDEKFDDISFRAKFASHVADLASLQLLSGVDGFMFNVEPLYKADAGHLWYLQVMYTIGSSSRSRARSKRSMQDAPAQNGTNIHVLALTEAVRAKAGNAQHILAYVLPLISLAALTAVGTWLALKHKKWWTYRRCGTTDDMQMRNIIDTKSGVSSSGECTEL